MENDRYKSGLRAAAGLLLDKLKRRQHRSAARSAELDDLIREAQTHEHRRAQYNMRDRAAYKLGGAFEPSAGLDLDDVQLAGLLALGQVAVLVLARAALAQSDASLSELLRWIFLSKLGPQLRAHGIYCRWVWLKALYVEETETFLASKKGRDPKARWRAEKPTKNQIYLASEISRLLQIVVPQLGDRGAAFDWIGLHGGNPRFWQAPPAIDLAEIEALFR